MVMGCNSGEVKGEGTGGEGRGAKSLSEILLEVGRSAGDAFYSFLELVSGTLGFNVNKETKKEDVGKYFNSLEEKIGVASEELEKIAVKVSADVDKEGVLNKGVREAVDAAKITLKILRGHLDSLKGIGDGNKVVEVANNQQGAAASTEELKKAYKALKGIVGVAKGEGVKEASASSVTLASNSIGVDAKDGARVLAKDANSGEASGEKAALIVSSVRGEEILESIINSTEDKAVKISNDATVNTTPLEFAVGADDASKLAKEAVKAGAVAGGIALRSLIKGGKLAAKDSNDGKAVQGTGITAVNKLLVAVEGIVKKTVKNVLEKVKQEIDKAREPKAVGQQ
ncbi:Variable major outer membrane lipoprotein (plasmid) [Borrelia crocidurae DOU]|uniref:Variable large protein n=2 Tax=Borrelia crocidurae TaxID=29520 RepID=W5SS94_9SPIR|nr:variable large family protein [Borrelia crocidurae]AHH07891.1 Variable major outer membrane lipoprotein [Borrelia crocidurae DOU]